MGSLIRYSIPYKGFSAGIHDFEFEIDNTLFESVGSTDILGGKAVAKVKMTKSASMLLLDFDIKGTVKVECDRCLDEMDIPVDTDARLTVKFSEEPADRDDEVMWVNPADGDVRLDEFLYETILLSLPYQKVHASVEECNQDMIRRFKIVTQEEFDKITAPKANALEDGEKAKLEEFKHKLENK